MSKKYRDHAYVVEALLDGGVWTGRYRLLGDPAAVPAGHAQKFTWVSMEHGWATRQEAETNAEEAAHAAIDAVYGIPARIDI
ncbi:hypothetical protein [Pelomonas sp. KK5]|uniref:hypothetical protein n=1 Tax=Pelomonas sp. KK5 TaxID=1855730 RepID=UPI00097C6494|nr:hypothetical protein [Pelomonas sp. KK5]